MGRVAWPSGGGGIQARPAQNLGQARTGSVEPGAITLVAVVLRTAGEVGTNAAAAVERAVNVTTTTYTGSCSTPRSPVSRRGHPNLPAAPIRTMKKTHSSSKVRLLWS